MEVAATLAVVGLLALMAWDRYQLRQLLRDHATDRHTLISQIQRPEDRVLPPFVEPPPSPEQSDRDKQTNAELVAWDEVGMIQYAPGEEPD